MASSTQAGSPATPGQAGGEQGPPRRRRRSPEAARAEIVAAAEAALGDMPFSALTVDILMQRTGMTRSSFYHYFTSLDDLVLALLVRFERDLVDSVEPWLSGTGVADGADPGDRRAQLLETEAALTRMLGVFREHGLMINAVNQAASGNPTVYRHWQTRVIGAFIGKTAGFIEAQVARGLSRAEDPPRLANALIRMNSAVVQENLARRDPDEPERVARVLAGIWNAAIYG